MRILILDDDPARHDWFADHYRGHELVTCWTAAQAIAALDQVPDLIHLDHDLELSAPGAQRVDGGTWLPDAEAYDEERDCGRAVVAAMVERPERPRVIVHSWNARGGRLMVDALERAGFEVSFLPWRWQDDRGFARRVLRNAGLPETLPQGDGRGW